MRNKITQKKYHEIMIDYCVLGSYYMEELLQTGEGPRHIEKI